MKETGNRKQPMIRDFLTSKTTDAYCMEIETTVNKSGSVNLLHREGVLVIQSKIDGSVRKIVQVQLCAQTLYMPN